MKRQFVKALLGGLFLAAGLAQAQDVVRIGTLSDYPPFEYKDASGQLKGMEIELGNAMCKHMQAKCEYVTMDFDALIPALKAKKIDAVLAQMSITAERKKSCGLHRSVHPGTGAIRGQSGLWHQRRPG